MYLMSSLSRTSSDEELPLDTGTVLVHLCQLFKKLECPRQYPSTMVCAGIAVLLHVQKFWIVSAEWNNLLAEAQRFETGSAFWTAWRC